MSRSGRIASVWVPGLAGRKMGVENGFPEGGASGLDGEGGGEDMHRIGSGEGDPAELTAALLSASPRVRRAAPALWRADARGFERRGGAEALAEALRGAAAAAGFPDAGVGVADVPVAADAAARLAAPGSRVVPPGESGEFLAPLSVSLLPISEEMRETLRALGLRRVGEVAARPREEWEARFGPEGLQLHRWARGEDHRRFRATVPGETPGASVELDEGVEEMEPLLFFLRRLLARVCEKLAKEGRCVARLRLCLQVEGEPGGSKASDGASGGDVEQEAVVRPARPTRRQDVLFDLCRAALERRVRASGGEGDGAMGPGASSAGAHSGTSRAGGGPDAARPPRRVTGLALVVERTAPAETRQGDLFVRRWRDPVQAAAVLSRLRARLGEEAAVWPAPRAEHRPERRNRWEAVGSGASGAGDGVGGDESATGTGARGRSEVLAPEAGSTADSRVLPSGADSTRDIREDALSPTLRLLPEPVEVEVRMEGGSLTGMWDPNGRHEVVVAEGPERLSGDWWRDPYRREYYRVCTAEGELLWVFREFRRDGRLRWWLHGWWD